MTTEVRAFICFPCMTGCQKQFSLLEQKRLVHFHDEMVAAPAEHIVLVVDMAQPAPGMYQKYFICRYVKYQSQQRHNNPVLVKINTQ